MEALDNTDPALQIGASRALTATWGEPTVPRLLEALRDESTEVQNAARGRLERTWGEPTVPRLLEALGDPDSAIQEAAGKALMTAWGEFTPPRLLEALNDDDPNVNKAAYLALQATWGEPTVPRLLEALGDEDPEVQNAALGVLVATWDEPTVPKLLEAMSGDDSHLSHAAQAALTATWGEPTLSRLTEVLKDQDPRIRAAAARLLGQRGNLTLALPLLEALVDSDESVQAAVLASVRELGLQPFDATVTIENEVQSPLDQGGLSQLDVRTMVRGGHAINLHIVLSGPAAGDVPVRRKLADLAEPDETLPWGATVKPLESGSVPIHWELTFDDVSGANQSLSGDDFLRLAGFRKALKVSSFTTTKGRVMSFMAAWTSQRMSLRWRLTAGQNPATQRLPQAAPRKLFKTT